MIQEYQINRLEAIRRLVGGRVSGNTNGSETYYDDGQTPPTEEEINAEFAELEAEYDAQEYARNRVPAYPSNGDQCDIIYKDMKNSTTTHADAVEAVKTKWPKDNSGPV